MTVDHSQLDQSTNYMGKDCVVVGNGPPLQHLAPSPSPSEPSTDSTPTAVIPLGTHPMFTRAKAGIFKTRHPANLSFLGTSGLLPALLASTKPKGFKYAAKNPNWLAAMDEEIHALKNNHTWVLVHWPANTNIVGSKWVLWTKYFPDESVERLKVRLVAKGYTQKWPIRQLDVKNVFLNGTLIDQVYMEQPPGLVDTSLFIYYQKSNIIYLLLYVDDIIITDNNYSLLDSFTCKLNSKFATKDLGSLSYFLGLKATPTSDGLFINQLKYARDILSRVQLLDSKPVHTPMVISQPLSTDGSLFSDPTLYKSLVGTLQYLTITRLDIAHAVNSVSQFLHAPIEDHFLAVKCILLYVRGTIHFDLTFCPSSSLGALVAYFDANWAGYPDTRRSTSGYSIYLGDNLVSWRAKKQPTVSCSSCESEYRVLAFTIAELIWLTHLLRDL
ncbi:uncharacterized mitochondrial protein AtMg00810-like [Juglans regia]|uniref:Uncharacterized mitochondrial protein AtMg00810-like n=1 Tax=Juglans regia TaxID=51240 RepID=A0A6P9DWP2_JUGRE|nr:uncharacterized mitochondrial protein AtMg00810-like [Juglans regia]